MKTTKKVAPKKAVKKVRHNTHELLLNKREKLMGLSRFIVTNDVLKHVQKYFYFSGDSYIEQEIEENTKLLATLEQSEVKDFLKISNENLIRIKEKSYGANDFFLNDVIRANDAFLNNI